MALGVGSLVLVAAAISMFVWALNRRGGREEIRKNALLVAVLAVMLVAVAILIPNMMSTSARKYIVAGAAMSSALWAFWTSSRLGPGIQASRVRIGLMALGVFLALLAVAALFVLR